MTPEKELLILTCNVKPSKDVNDNIYKLLGSDVDGDNFLRLMYRNGTHPLVYNNFKDILPDDLRPHTFRSLPCQSCC